MNSVSRQHLIGLMTAALVLGAISGAEAQLSSPPAIYNFHTTHPGDGSVTTTTGIRVEVAFEPEARALNAFVQLRDGRHVALADGAYSLTNGGAIRVRGGRIVWDAFGVVDKLQRGIPVDHSGNNNG